jgi:hypothetical protein
MIVALPIAGVIVIGFALFVFGFILGDCMRAAFVRPCEYCRSNKYPRGTSAAGTWRCRDFDGCRFRSAKHTEKSPCVP